MKVLSLKRLPVTLLELLIVIAILAMVSGAIMIGINKAIVDQRFRSEVSMVVDTLRLAQDLMLILGADVKLVFQETKDQEGIEYWLDFDTLLPQNVKREVSKRLHKLKTIKGVFFVDKAFSKVEKGKITLNFFSHGSMMSRGILRLATSDQENPAASVLQNFICLSGYPRPIKSEETNDPAEKACFLADSASQGRLTEDTWNRLPDKVKKLKKEDDEASRGTDEDTKENKANKKSNESK